MSQPAWISGATKVSQVDTFTPGTVTTGDVSTLTVKDENGATVATINYTTATGNDATAVTTGLKAAWAANVIAAALATASGTATVILTAVTSGVPFHVTSSVAGSGTLARVATTANAGPNDWSTAANWSTGAVPVNSDTVTIDGRGGSTSATAILYGLQQTGVTLTELRHYKSAPPVGTITAALSISATTANAYIPPNDGSSPSGAIFNFNPGSNLTTMNIYGSPNQGTGGLPPCLIAGTNVGNTLNLYNSPVVGVGLVTPGQSCSYPTATVNGGTLTLGTGTTAPTTLTNNGGNITIGLGNASGTIVNNKGDCTVNGGTIMSVVTANGGKVHYNVRASGNDVTTVNLDGGEFDISGAADAATVATLALKKGGTIRLASSGQLTVTSTTYDATNKVNLIVLVGN